MCSNHDVDNLYMLMQEKKIIKIKSGSGAIFKFFSFRLFGGI